MRESNHMPRSRSSAFNLGQLPAIIAITFVLAAILFPVFAGTREHGPHGSCLSNEKQIGLAILEYEQDYDEMMPPASAPRSPESKIAVSANMPKALTKSPIVMWPELIDPYLKSAAIYQCPEVGRAANGDFQICYRYSDLLNGVKLADFTGPAQTVILSEGEPDPFNIGHAYTPESPLQPAVFGRKGTVVPGYGETIDGAAVRHTEHANYLLADGHARAYLPSDVFFPTRQDMRRSHIDAGKKTIGPDPHDMTLPFEGKSYKATYQLQ